MATSVPSRPHSSPRRGPRYSAGWCSTHSGSSAMPSRNCPFCSGVQRHDRTARASYQSFAAQRPSQASKSVAWACAALQVDVLGRIEGDQTLSDRVVERLAQRRLDAVRGRSRRSPIRRQGIELLAELAPDRAGGSLVRPCSSFERVPVIVVGRDALVSSLILANMSKIRGTLGRRDRNRQDEA